jgi:glyoxylase-like metal-dependent hydrolase (beta-lactamase superfamily II)
MTSTPSERAFICVTCGTQFPPSPAPPVTCPICTDERQYVPATGQAWTTLSQLQRGHRNAFQRLEPHLYGIGTVPPFAIGQRALLVRTPAGNILWDCISLLDDATIDILTALGGLEAIAISHPHYYTTMVEWSRAFGGVPIWLHARDRQWVMRPDPSITYWEGATQELLPGVRLIHCGGHFAGGSILSWEAGAEGGGALLTGDILQVVQDRRYVSFMRSYPNLIPLSPAEVERIAATVARLRFDRVYGAWWDAHVVTDAHAAVQSSARRYVAWSRASAGSDSAES